MSSKLHSLSEASKLASGYKKVALFNAEGEKILAFNANNKKVSDKIKEIAKKMASDTCPDGYYFIEARDSFGKAVKPDRYMFKKGDPSGNQPNVTVIENMGDHNDNGTASHVLSYDQALELNTKLNKLELENEQLKAEAEAAKKGEAVLQEALSELDDSGALDEKPTSGINSLGKMLSESAEAMLPAFDRFMDFKEKELAAGQQQIQVEMMYDGLMPTPLDNLHMQMEMMQNGYTPGQTDNGQVQQMQQQLDYMMTVMGQMAQFMQQVPGSPPMPQPQPPGEEGEEEVEYEEVPDPAGGYSLQNPPQQGTNEFMQWLVWVSENHPEQYKQMIEPQA